MGPRQECINSSQHEVVAMEHSNKVSRRVPKHARAGQPSGGDLPSIWDAANFSQRDRASRVPSKLGTKRPEKHGRQHSGSSSTNISRSAYVWTWGFLASRIEILRLSVPVATWLSPILRPPADELQRQMLATNFAAMQRSFTHVDP